jgi:hypothetical protein
MEDKIRIPYSQNHNNVTQALDIFNCHVLFRKQVSEAGSASNIRYKYETYLVGLLDDASWDYYGRVQLKRDGTR